MQTCEESLVWILIGSGFLCSPRESGFLQFLHCILTCSRGPTIWLYFFFFNSISDDFLHSFSLQGQVPHVVSLFNPHCPALGWPQEKCSTAAFNQFIGIRYLSTCVSRHGLTTASTPWIWAWPRFGQHSIRKKRIETGGVLAIGSLFLLLHLDP